MNKIEMKKRILRTMLATTLSLGVISSYSQDVYAETTYTEKNTINDLNQVSAPLLKYCTIFNLDYNKVYPLLVQYSLSDTNVNGIQYGSSEEAILSFVYDIYFNSKQYGISRNDIINPISNYEMTSSLEETILRYSNLLGIDYEIALSISYAECGVEADSHNYLVNNNPAGIGPHMKFANKEVGIIYYCFMLKNKYNLTPKNDENFFGKVANIYCKENPKHWINLTNGIYSNVQGNYFYYSTQASAKIEEDNAKVLHKTKI